MKKRYSLLAMLGLSLAASAAVPNVSPVNVAEVGEPAVEKVAKMIKSRSIESPETEFTATKARFYYYHDYNKDEKTSCYQLVITNSEAGFSSGGTLPAGPGQLLCVFLCGPISEDKENPVLPAGKYEFSKTSGEIYTFTPRYSHYVDAFMYNDGLAGWQLPPVGGTIEITEEDGVYNVVAKVTAAEVDEETDEEVSVDVTATYTGAITLPPPLPELSEENYEMTIPEFGGMYDKSQKVFQFSFYGCSTDDYGMVNGAGDLLNVFIYYDGETPYADLPGEYEYVEYSDYAAWSNGRFLGGFFFKLSADFVIPMGTYCSRYDEYGGIEACGLAEGGKITVTAPNGGSDGVLKFDFDLVAKNGISMTGSWEGNVIGKLLGIETTGIEDLVNEGAEISGQAGCVVAPADAKVYTTSGVAVSKENLNAGIYIVNHNGKAVKVVVK